MPQLIPYYFFNQIVSTFVILLILVYIVSKYILPTFTFTQIIRTYILKLTTKN